VSDQQDDSPPGYPPPPPPLGTPEREIWDAGFYTGCVETDANWRAWARAQQPALDDGRRVGYL